MFELKYAGEAIEPILTCMPATLGLTFGSVLIALILGILLALGIKAPFRPLHIIFKILVSFLKGIPILVLLYVFNTSMDDIMYGLGGIFGFTYNIRTPPTFLFAVLALALSYAPYMCDMITTAMDTIPKGQWEACDSLGFTGWQKLYRIIIPQTVVIAIPNFGNHFVNLLKATSLACMVTIMEMMGGARNFATLNQRFLEPYTVCALIYWAVFIIFEQIFRILEKQTGKYLEAGTRIKRRKRRILAFVSQDPGYSRKKGTSGEILKVYERRGNI